MIDPSTLSRIATNWKQGESARWLVADEAALVVGQYANGATQEIADALVVSVDTIERLARAGRAWKCIKQRVDDSVALRNLSTSYFDAVGKCVENGLLDWSDAYEWLMDCLQDRWTIEKFRAQLPSKSEPNDYRKTCESYAKKIDYDLITAPFLGVDETKAVKVRRAAMLLKGRMKDLLEAE